MGDAQHLSAPINDPDRDEWYPAVAASGNLYFSSERPGTRGGTDLWMARRVDGGYAAPENLGDAINTPRTSSKPGSRRTRVTCCSARCTAATASAAMTCS